MKKPTSLILLIALLFSLAGCAGKETPKVTINEILKYDEAGYFISDIQWLNNEEVLIKIGSGDNNSLAYKVYTFNTETHKGTLLYEGNGNNYHMDGNTLTLCDNDKMYVYNAEYCLEFVNKELEHSYNLKERFDEVFGENTYVATSLNINKEGICSLIYDGDIVTFPLNDVGNYEVLIERTGKLIDADKITELVNAGRLDEYKEVPATYYYLPLWSPDGKWILYTEKDTLTGHTNKVIMYNLAKKKKKSFNFKYKDYYRWADTSDYVIACARPTHAPEPEVKVYNLNTDECKSFVFDEAVNGVSFSSIKVLDVAGSKILLSCHKRGLKRPLLMLDFITGEKEWITEPNSKVLSAVISPDKDKIFCYAENNDRKSLEVKNID